MSGRAIAALLVASTLVTGCTTLGGNVKGAFSCRAPAGTCAPTSTIDAKAVDADRGDSPASALTGRPRPLATAYSGAAPVRSVERTITIIFPPYVDAAGVLHDQAMAHAVVEPPHWAPLPADPVSFSRSPAPSSLREVVAGASARATEGLEPLPTQAPRPIAVEGQTPTADAIAAARSGHRIEHPAVTAVGPKAGTQRSTASEDARSARAAEDKVRKAIAPALAKPMSEPALDDIFRPVPGPGGGQ